MTDFLSRLKEKVDSIKSAAIATRESISSLVVSDEVKNTRLEICNSCEFLFIPTRQCKKCGCFVNAKTSIALFKCPIDKWHAINIDENKSE